MAANDQEVRVSMRLISFLGTGNYGETTYSFESRTCRTRYVAQALASFIRPNEIRLIATAEAWNQHGDALAQRLSGSGHPVPEQVRVPTGGEPQQLWQMFGAIVEVIRTSGSPVLLDITHGFRMQPFFAAACIQYVQSVLPNPPQIRVVYGEYRGAEQESPIWELTPFLEVLSWSRNLMMFLRTGQADEIVKETESLGRALNKQRADEGAKSAFSQLPRLAGAMKGFGDDFTTIRTGSLLIGKGGETPSAQQLWDAIEQTWDEVAQRLPALALVLDQVRAMVEPLRTGGARLSSADGQRVLLALARQYQKMGRYSEGISVLREGWSTLNAPDNADMPGSDEFDDEERKKWDNQWAYRTGHPDSTTEVRNDIQHAGFRRRPNKPDWFQKRLDELLAEWEKDISATAGGHPE
jgi:CRISPR-associated protein Csx16